MSSRGMRWVSFLAVCLAFACSGDKDKGGAAPSAGTSASKPGAPATPSAPTKLDGCALLTQEDATALFGKPAARHKGAYTPDPALLADCEWDHDEPDYSSQLLQLQVWDGERGYSADPESKPFAIGDKGNIRASDLSGVDIMWVQKGKTIAFSYFATGPSVPKSTTKLEQAKALAKKIESRL